MHRGDSLVRLIVRGTVCGRKLVSKLRISSVARARARFVREETEHSREAASTRERRDTSIARGARGRKKGSATLVTKFTNLETNRRMGLDGGTIASRTDILRGSSWDVANASQGRGAKASSRGGAIGASYVHKGERLESGDARASRSAACALTGETLSDDVVACELGALYNKTAMLEFVLARQGRFTSAEATYRYANLKSGHDEATRHLKSSRDFMDVKLTRASEGDGRFECPIRGIKAGGKSRVDFVAMRPCGCVLSAAAAKLGGETCAVCNAETTGKPQPILPEDEETIRELRENLEQRQEADASKEEAKRLRKKNRRKLDRWAADEESRRVKKIVTAEVAGEDVGETSG